MGKQKKQTLGREAINVIKDAYRDGSQFEGTFAIRTFLFETLKVKTKSISYESAQNWDRQARLELADHDKVSVTSPFARQPFLRNPNAEAPERMRSRKSRLKDTHTRVRHDHIELKADVAQPDATEVERLQAAALEAAEILLKSVSS